MQIFILPHIIRSSRLLCPLTFCAVLLVKQVHSVGRQWPSTQHYYELYPHESNDSFNAINNIRCMTIRMQFQHMGAAQVHIHLCMVHGVVLDIIIYILLA